jgi:LacI family transcriptional regulator
MPDIKNTFFNSWFRGVEEYARSFNYTLLLCNTDENIEHEMSHVRLLHSHRVDGIMIVAHSHESVAYLKKSKMPFILVDRVYTEVESDFVTTDHYSGAFEAVEYLVSLGHKKIGLLKGPGVLYPDVERYRGFSDVMKKHRLINSQLYVRNCEFQEAPAFDAVGELLENEDRPTAIFSFNSLMTIGAVKAVQSKKLIIPDHISLIGYDEIPGQTIFKPAMTYVLQPIEELGRNATKILLEKIMHPRDKKKHRVFLKPKLVVGDSCRKIRS